MHGLLAQAANTRSRQSLDNAAAGAGRVVSSRQHTNTQGCLPMQRTWETGESFSSMPPMPSWFSDRSDTTWEEGAWGSQHVECKGACRTVCAHPPGSQEGQAPRAGKARHGTHSMPTSAGTCVYGMVQHRSSKGPQRSEQQGQSAFKAARAISTHVKLGGQHRGDIQGLPFRVH